MDKTPEPTSLFGDAFDDDTPATPPSPAIDAGSGALVPPSQDSPFFSTEPSASDTSSADTPPEAAPPAQDEPVAAGSDTAVHEDALAESPAPDAPPGPKTVGSVDEMDAWLSQAGDAPGSSAWSPTDAEADDAMAAWLAAAPNAVPAEEGPVLVEGGRLDRIRPKRKPLVPRWLVWVLLAVLLVGGATAGVAAFVAARSRVQVPTVAGLQTQEAKERLATVGLKLTVSDRRFSTLPVDTILSQSPETGSELRRGGTVTVVVSAGTEEFTMPDVVGQGLTLAKSQLEQKGLEVQVESQLSDQPSDTVLFTNPAAGAAVHTGDIIKITVATGTTASTTTSATLVPFSLNGVKITLDPAPPIAGQPDTALEVTRRLQSLLEASGATVRTTRSITDTGTTGSATARQLRAKEGSPTVAVGFDIIASGAPGMALAYPNSTVAPTIATASQNLSSQITSALAGQGMTSRQAAGNSDVVLSVTGSPYTRLTLGSTASREDLASFKDPAWADKVARAVYQGIASVFGVRNPAVP
ncbi:MAG: PASTA domain-containing protein [Coriobacteriia bacterium]|nr:PASTA domain-containing protein [Coriobacteriia bacterium]